MSGRGFLAVDGLGGRPIARLHMTWRGHWRRPPPPSCPHLMRASLARGGRARCGAAPRQETVGSWPLAGSSSLLKGGCGAGSGGAQLGAAPGGGTASVAVPYPLPRALHPRGRAWVGGSALWCGSVAVRSLGGTARWSLARQSWLSWTRRRGQGTGEFASGTTAWRALSAAVEESVLADKPATTALADWERTPGMLPTSRSPQSDCSGRLAGRTRRARVPDRGGAQTISESSSGLLPRAPTASAAAAWGSDSSRGNS